MLYVHLDFPIGEQDATEYEDNINELEHSPPPAGVQFGRAGDGDGLRGFHMIKWDGRDPEKKMTFKGDYLVRWTLNGKYRDYAIQID